MSDIENKVFHIPKAHNKENSNGDHLINESPIDFKIINIG